MSCFKSYTGLVIITVLVSIMKETSPVKHQTVDTMSDPRSSEAFRKKILAFYESSKGYKTSAVKPSHCPESSL